MLRYLLDTNIVIYVLKRRPVEVLSTFNANANRMALSSITLAELLHGAEKSSRVSENLSTIEDFCSRLVVLPYGANAAQHYGAIRATLELMAAPADRVTVRTSYNLGGISFTPREIAAAIQKHIPAFTCTYNPDPLRQRIADSWPASIDDSKATADWKWHAAYDLDTMTADMLLHLGKPA